MTSMRTPDTVDGQAAADSGVADTSVADTAVADTSVADTSVADTGVADTGVADTAVADTAVADTADGQAAAGSHAANGRAAVDDGTARSDAEAPAGTEAAADTEAPAGTEAAADTEAPAGTEAAETEAPAANGAAATAAPAVGTAASDAGPAVPAVPAPGEPGARIKPAGRIIPLVRKHWLLSALLLAGLVLRVLTQIAYRPALLYIDSVKYIYNAWPGSDPVGYKVPLTVILLFGNLQTVAAVQHLLGLAMAVTIYAVLLRRGTARWLAALAAAPVLLDAYQLQMEQTIMPDVWSEALIVGGLALLLWHPRLTIRAVVLAGVVLGSAATVRQVDEILGLPALIFVLVAVGGRWRKLVAAGAMCMSCAVPILGYSTIAYLGSGHFGLAKTGSTATYGRFAEAADCATLKLPADERALCPTASEKALGADGLDHDANSSLDLYKPPRGTTRDRMANRFDMAVLTQQPLNVASGFAADVVRLYSVTRTTVPGDTPIYRWQFQDGYPTYGATVSLDPDHVIVVGLKAPNSIARVVYQPLNPALGGRAMVIRPIASFLRGYQLHGGYTPGPVYLLATLAGIAGSLTLVRWRRRDRREPGALARPLALLRRRRGITPERDAGPERTSLARPLALLRWRPGDRPERVASPERVARPEQEPAERQLALACLAFFAIAAALLLLSDLFEFSWRYQLPAVVTLPPAGALGIAIIIGRVKSRRRAAAARSQTPDAAASAG
jgi:hypothetical protein